MPTTLAPSSGIDAIQFGQHLDTLNKLPEWWLQVKKDAWDRFSTLPMPTRKDEAWRFAHLAGLALDGYRLPQSHTEAPGQAPEFAHTAKLVFDNNQLVGRSTISDELKQKGVIFAPLNEALLEHGDLIREWFQKYPAALGGDKFISLNAAFTTSGALLYVPAGVEIEPPFVLQHSASGTDSAVFPHTIVILADNAKATLVEFFASADDTRHLASGVNDLHAGAGAKLTYVGAQNWSESSLAFQSNEITAQKDAEVLSLNLHLGGRQCRHEAHARLLGEGARSEMLSLSVPNHSQEFDQRTLQTHTVPNCYSNVLYKNALMDQSRTIFSGLIVVEEGAQKTDAYQSNRNLMLSDTAESNSLPGLEIKANDVKCSHGATTARVDAEQGFYLQTRGIDPAKANELLVFGFFEEVLNRLSNDELHAILLDLIRAKFAK